MIFFSDTFCKCRHSIACSKVPLLVLPFIVRLNWIQLGRRDGVYACAASVSSENMNENSLDAARAGAAAGWHIIKMLTPWHSVAAGACPALCHLINSTALDDIMERARSSSSLHLARQCVHLSRGLWLFRWSHRGRMKKKKRASVFQLSQWTHSRLTMFTHCDVPTPAQRRVNFPLKWSLDQQFAFIYFYVWCVNVPLFNI